MTIWDRVLRETTMPMHDWTRVIAGIFHDFHHEWISTIRNALNSGLLPADYYALAEQAAEGPIPDVLTLERASPQESDPGTWRAHESSGGVALTEHPPRVTYTVEAEQQNYALKANRVAVFHTSGDRVVAFIEIVSPGNKHSETSVRRFAQKLEDALERGCHLLIIDPHPPTPRDPHGLHVRFWGEAFAQPDIGGVTDDQPLSVMAYRSDLVPTGYMTPFAVGEPVPDMPLFLDPDHYVNVPLEQTYQAAWATMPERWKRVIEGR
jgi:hypothetical protein